LFFLSDVRSSFRDIPSSCFTEPVPEIVEGGEVPGFDRNHSVVGGAPDVGIFRDYFHVLGEVLLEAFPVRGRLLLVSFRQRSYAVEDEECEYHRTTPWFAVDEGLG
jgi:hypothetical protein